MNMGTGSVVTVLEKLAKWLEHRGPERLARWLENLPPGALRLIVEIGGGLLLGVVIVVLLFVVVVKFGARIFGQFVKHDTFPAVVTTAIFVIPIVVTYATVPALPSVLTALSTAIVGAIGMHPQAVKIRDNARKNDLPADKTPEPPHLPTGNPEH